MDPEKPDRILVCIPGKLDPLEDILRSLKEELTQSDDSRSQLPDQSNVIRPSILQWNGDIIRQSFFRLAENLTREQLTIFKKTLGEFYPNAVGIDIFTALFGCVLDNMPANVFSLSMENRVLFVYQVAARCLHSTSICTADFENLEFRFSLD